MAPATRAEPRRRLARKAEAAAPEDGAAFSIAWWDVSRVRPYGRNPRTIPEAAVEKVAASIRAFGWQQPIVVDEEGVILAGHTRFKAAQLMGSARVPVHVAEGLTAAQARAYRLADNRVAEETDWNHGDLRLELADLQASAEPVFAALGFDGDELDRMLAAEVTGGGIEEPPASNYSEQYGVIVMCADAAEQKRVYDELVEAGHTVKVVTT